MAWPWTGNGNLYIADLWNSRVLLETWNSGAGTYTKACLRTCPGPRALALDEAGISMSPLYRNSSVVEVQTSAIHSARSMWTTSSKMTMTFAFDSPGILGARPC